MQLYRLVNEKFDPVQVGSRLERSSSNSNQKLGDGMYFAVNRQSALDFAATRNHPYTHLLTCEVEGITEDDLADMVSDPACVTRWKGSRRISSREAYVQYCAEHGLRGIRAGFANWEEIVIHDQHLTGNVRIVDSEKLPEQDDKEGSPPKGSGPMKVARRISKPSDQA